MDVLPDKREILMYEYIHWFIYSRLLFTWRQYIYPKDETTCVSGWNTSIRQWQGYDIGHTSRGKHDISHNVMRAGHVLYIEQELCIYNTAPRTQGHYLQNYCIYLIHRSAYTNIRSFKNSSNTWWQQTTSRRPGEQVCSSGRTHINMHLVE